MCKACRLPDLSAALPLSQWQCDGCLPCEPAGGVGLAGFLHALPLIAAKKFPDPCKPEDALHRLLVDHLLPYMGVPEDDLMISTREIVKRREHELMGCYKHWAASDARDANFKLLSCFECFNLLRAEQLIGKELTVMQVRLRLRSSARARPELMSPPYLLHISSISPHGPELHEDAYECGRAPAPPPERLPLLSPPLAPPPPNTHGRCG